MKASDWLRIGIPEGQLRERAEGVLPQRVHFPIDGTTTARYPDLDPAAPNLKKVTFPVPGVRSSVMVSRMSVSFATSKRSKRDSCLVLLVTGMRRLCALDVACRGCAKTAKKALLPRGMRRIVSACMYGKAAVEPDETHPSTPESRNLKQTTPVVVIL